MGTTDTHSRGLRFVRLFRLLNGEMPMQQADILLTIARQPGIGTADLQQQCQLAQSSVSRNVAALSRVNKGEGGLDLVVTEIDPKAPKRRIYFLTEKGERFVTSLLEVIDGDFSIDAMKVRHALNEEEQTKASACDIPSGRNAPLRRLVP